MSHIGLYFTVYVHMFSATSAGVSSGTMKFDEVLIDSNIFVLDVEGHTTDRRTDGAW